MHRAKTPSSPADNSSPLIKSEQLHATFWWLANVFVRRGWRRRGVYTEMHGFVQARAADDPKVCGIRLFTTAENHAAQRAYDRVGMTSEAAFFCEVDYVLGG